MREFKSVKTIYMWNSITKEWEPSRKMVVKEYETIKETKDGDSTKSDSN